jgi:hypothetical protein
MALANPRVPLRRVPLWFGKIWNMDSADPAEFGSAALLELNPTERLLITTAIGLVLGTSACAQSPSDQKNNPPLRRKAVRDDS